MILSTNEVRETHWREKLNSKILKTLSLLTLYGLSPESSIQAQQKPLKEATNQKKEIVLDPKEIKQLELKHRILHKGTDPEIQKYYQDLISKIELTIYELNVEYSKSKKLDTTIEQKATAIDQLEIKFQEAADEGRYINKENPKVNEFMSRGMSLQNAKAHARIHYSEIYKSNRLAKHKLLQEVQKLQKQKSSHRTTKEILFQIKSKEYRISLLELLKEVGLQKINLNNSNKTSKNLKSGSNEFDNDAGVLKGFFIWSSKKIDGYRKEMLKNPSTKNIETFHSNVKEALEFFNY